MYVALSTRKSPRPNERIAASQADIGHFLPRRIAFYRIVVPDFCLLAKVLHRLLPRISMAGSARTMSSHCEQVRILVNESVQDMALVF